MHSPSALSHNFSPTFPSTEINGTPPPARRIAAAELESSSSLDYWQPHKTSEFCSHSLGDQIGLNYNAAQSTGSGLCLLRAGPENLGSTGTMLFDSNSKVESSTAMRPGYHTDCLSNLQSNPLTSQRKPPPALYTPYMLAQMQGP